MIDAVLSPHSPLTCGTAKWSAKLAKRLGVPFVQLHHGWPKRPLISTRLSEWPDLERFPRPYELFVHDWSRGHHNLVLWADTVYAANRELADQLRGMRPDVITAWCPSSLDGKADRPGYRVLTFGMAHKLNPLCYLSLKDELAETHPDYTIEWTCAVHEGRPWEAEFSRAEEALRKVFGDRLRVLGSLADDGLAKALQECDAVALYFPEGVRENNTTAWAAIEAGKPLYTNRDEKSPEFDIQKYSWDALLQTMGVSVAV